MGNDSCNAHILAGRTVFQSTFPRGERPCTLYDCSDTGYFNPRSRVGNDVIDFPSRSSIFIFQSTFPRGERQMRYLFLLRLQSISIHVPAWGTTIAPFTIPITLLFQSTFPRGERLIISFLPVFRKNFNPRSRVGNDHLQSSVTL